MLFLSSGIGFLGKRVKKILSINSKLNGKFVA
jgi:hypothetical protein